MSHSTLEESVASHETPGSKKYALSIELDSQS